MYKFLGHNWRGNWENGLIWLKLKEYKSFKMVLK